MSNEIIYDSCMNIIFNSLLAQLVKYDVHTTRKIKSIHAIFITYNYYVQDSILDSTGVLVLVNVLEWSFRK